jgi:EF-hand domain pair/EF hand
VKESEMKLLITMAVLASAASAGYAQRGGGLMWQGSVTRAQVEARVRERFAQVDANRDGAFTREEVQSARQDLVKKVRDSRFELLDQNKDGSVSRAEFDAARGDNAQNGGNRMRRGQGGQGAGFARRDENSDGKVTLSEALSRSLARFDEADANKDGTLTPEERMAARGKLRGGRSGLR